MWTFLLGPLMGETEGLILLFLQFGVLAMFWLNPWSTREASHHPVFKGNRSTIIHTFLALSTQWMSCPSRKWGRGVSLWFHLVAFVLGVNQENWGAGESRIPNSNGGQPLCRPSNSYRKLLDRVAFRILSNINDEAPQRKYVAHL